MDPQALVARQKQEFQGLLDRQKGEQQGLFGAYEQRINAQPKLVNVFQDAQQQRGLPQLQDTINLFQGQIGDVKSLIDRLGENTQARTAGTNANQAYLDRMRAVEGGQLNTQLGRLATGIAPVIDAYQLASSDISQLLELTQTDQATALKPLELQINALSDRFAREITGYTKSKEDELTVLLDKLARDRQLADAEKQRVAQLAAEEREYARRAALLAAEQKKNVLGSGIPAFTPKKYNINLNAGGLKFY